MSEWPQFLITDRQQGKTTALIEWVKQGERIPRYPGWSRVLVCANRQRADQLRGGPDHPSGLEYQQVFYIDEFLKGRIQADVEIALDDADEVLRSIFRQGRLSLISATGTVVSNPNVPTT